MSRQVLKIIEFAAMVLAVAGVCLNNGQIIWCFPVWMVSNILCAYLHSRAGLKWLVLRDGIFTGLAVVGWWMWAGSI
jgi:nicotinamide riboside transporter PnuC